MIASTGRLAALWFLLALAIGFGFAHVALPGIAPASDMWDYAQEARQLARGQGFTSLYTYPTFLDGEEAPFSVRWRMPLYAALGALLLRLGIGLPAGFLYLGALAHAFLVALTFVLGARLSSARVGAWAAAGALACPLLLDFYNAGMSQTLAAVFGLVVWTLLLGRGGVVTAAVAGVVAAAAWYLRGESILFLPLWVWVSARARWSRAAVFVVIFAVLCLPWFLAARANGGTIQGNPMLLYTAEYPGYSSSRTLGVSLPGVMEYVLRHPGAFALRFAKDVVGYGIDLADGVGPIAVMVAVVGVVTIGARDAAAILRRHAPLVIAIALQILAMSALERSPRFLVPVVPLVLIVLAALASPLLATITRREALLALLLALVLERGGRLAYQRVDARRRFPPVPEGTAEVLKQRSRTWPNGLVLSDAPDWISWHLDRPALFLPLSGQIDSLVASRPVAAIWLSPAARARNVADRDTAWVRAMDRWDAVGGFRGPDALPGGSRLYVITSRGPAHPGRHP